MAKRAVDPAQYERFLRFCEMELEMEEEAKRDDASSRRHGRSTSSSGSKEAKRDATNSRRHGRSINISGSMSSSRRDVHIRTPRARSTSSKRSKTSPRVISDFSDSSSSSGEESDGPMAYEMMWDAANVMPMEVCNV